MTKRRTPSITWHASAKRLAAEPGATVAVDREAWEAAGAHFKPRDDHQGETPYLATGSAKTSSGSISFGVLDFGADVTYVLVPGTEETRPSIALRLLEVLEEVGALNIDDVVDFVDEPDRPGSLDERVGALESIVRQVLAVPGVAASLGERVAAKVIPVKRVEDRMPPTRRRGSRGTVKWFSDEKGFGFITPDDGGKDLFVHHTGIEGRKSKTLVEGTKVVFSVEEGPKIGVSIEEGEEGRLKQ